MTRFRFFFSLLLIFLAVSSCSDDLAMSPDAQPVLSTDTLDLGMTLAGNSTPTYQLKLYNRGDKELRLTSIALRDATSSGFRMNVDGMMGTDFSHSDLLRIAGGDSLFIFVEATFSRGTSTGSPVVEHSDYIDVLCNGRMQTVVLTARSKEVRLEQGLILTEDTSWPRGTELQIFDSLVIQPGVTLTIADSSTLYLHDKAHIVVYGTLKTQGSLANPVVFRGDRTDKMFWNLEYDNLPSQWGGIRFAPASSGNLLVHTDIRSMSDPVAFEGDTLLQEERQAELRSCRIANGGSALVFAHHSNLYLENCLLSNAAGSLLYLQGGSYDIVYCTLANYNFAAAVQLESLYLGDSIQHCHLTNTLIWGDWHNPDVRLDCESGFRFDHCLLRADGTDDNDFLSTVWNQDPLFVTIDKPNYTFDFQLQEESPARNAGIPCGIDTDLEGRPRGVTPTIGCYEFISEP